MEGGVFGVLDVAVTLGFAFQGVASKQCFPDKSQLKWRVRDRKCFTSKCSFRGRYRTLGMVVIFDEL